MDDNNIQNVNGLDTDIYVDPVSENPEGDTVGGSSSFVLTESLAEGSDASASGMCIASSGKNILNGGVDILNAMKTEVVALDTLKLEVKELEERQQQLTKDISSMKKAMDSEISTTVSKRQAELEKTFDEQIEATRSRLKGVKNKRDKYKGTKVDERVSVETAELREQIRSLKQDIKGILTKQHIWRIFNNQYFFTLYMPDGIGDFLVILLSIIIVLALPLLGYALIPEDVRKIGMLVILYIAIVGVVLGIFTLIFKFVRTKHLDSLVEIKGIRAKITRIKKKIKKTEKSIRKDKDESGYGLEKYDEEINSLDEQIDDIIARQKQALTEFENETKVMVTDEIRARYNAELDALNAENEAAYAKQRGLEQRIKSVSLEISGKYAAYIGQENLSVSMIDNLIEIINSGDALNIADAIAYYKKLQTQQ